MRNLTLLALFLTTIAAGSSQAEQLQRLFWKNGDMLTGKLLKAKSETLVWKSPDFTEPFELNLDALSMIQIPREEKFTKTSEPFQAVFRSGDVMYGQLVALDDKNVTLKSARHGIVKLNRESVRSLRSLKNDALIYAGPTTADEWENIQIRRAKTSWQIDKDGRLSTSVRDSAVFNKIQIPDRAQIEFTLRWTKDPAFMLSLFRPVGNKVDSTALSFLIDTWDDEVVMETEADFVPLFTLTPKIKELPIRLYWDRKKGELSVYSGDGTHIDTMNDVKGNGKLPTGIYLRNKGSNLSIGEVRVGQWNGMTPQPVKKGQSRLHLSDGNILYGEIRDFSKDQGSISIARGKDAVVKNDGNEADADNQTARLEKHELEKVDSIYFEDDDRNWKLKSDVNLSFFDGERLGGTVISIEGDRAKLKTVYSSDPIDTDLKGSRNILMSKGSSEVPKNLSKLEYEGGSIHGKFAGGNTAENAIAWKPFGSLNASPLAGTSNARVVRATTGRKQSPSDELIDVIYLRNRDVLPCRIHAIAKDVIHIKTGFGERERIKASQVKAIELASDSEIQITGFTSDRWKFRPDDNDSFSRDDQSITFHRAGTVGNSTILRGNEVRFDATWDVNNVCQLDLRLFSGDVMQPTSPAVGLMFTFSSNQVDVGPSNPANRRRNLNEGGGRAAPANGKASIRVVVDQTQVKAFIGDKSVYTAPINRDNQNGRGLAFHLKTFGRNQVNKKLLNISNFEIRRSTNAKRTSPRINPIKKQTVLTNPRMYRDKAPTHIVIGKNGDLLRGRLETMSRDRMNFISRMDDLAIPRSRVSALVWLHKDELDEDAKPPKEVTKDRVRLVFVGGTTISITPTGFENDRLNGESAVLGKCSIPINLLSEIHVGNYVKMAETVAYSDWKMTAAPEPKMAGSSAGNSGDFGKSSPLVATVPDDFELDMVDGKTFKLSEHRGKIVVLDFWATWCPPCIRGMPEIMAAVDEFDDDEVVLCGVNLQEAKADIDQFLTNRKWDLNVAMDIDGDIAAQFAVRAVPQTVVIDKDGTIQFVHVGGDLEMRQNLSAAIRALLDGKTKIEDNNEAPAEEQIIGKDFADLELPLLNDKVFKISDHQGKVIVLDFWATWCGPCVKALPAISEIVQKNKKDVLLVAVNEMDPKADVMAFAKKQGWKFDIALDVDGEIGEDFRVENLPHTVLIGKDGKVGFVKTGYKQGDDELLAKQINDLITPEGEGPKPE